MVAQGDGPGGLAAYRKGLTIAEALAARDPANTQWQRDLSYSFTKLATDHADQGDHAGALQFAVRSLRIDEHLSTLDPSNAPWRQDVDDSRAQVARLRGQASA
jgi:hypothetical protein